MEGQWALGAALHVSCTHQELTEMWYISDYWQEGRCAKRPNPANVLTHHTFFLCFSFFKFLEVIRDHYFCNKCSCFQHYVLVLNWI